MAERRGGNGEEIGEREHRGKMQGAKKDSRESRRVYFLQGSYVIACKRTISLSSSKNSLCIAPLPSKGGVG